MTENVNTLILVTTQNEKDHYTITEQSIHRVSWHLPTAYIQLYN